MEQQEGPVSDVDNKGLRTLDEIRASRARCGDLNQVTDQIVREEPTWWGVKHGDQVTDPADIFRMIAAGINERLPIPIAVDTRMWAAETIIQVTPSHRDDWRAWWNYHGAGPWAVTQRQNGRYIQHRSHGNWRGWRVVILYVTESAGADTARAGGAR